MIRGSLVLRSVTARRFISSGTKYTTLSNGITVASETIPNAQHSSVGLYFSAGSRSEHPYNNGVSALTATVLSQQHNASADGVVVSAQNGREFNGIVAETTNDNIEAAGKLLSTIATNAEDIVSKADFQFGKNFLTNQANALEANPRSRVISHLSATAYQGYSLGLPKLGTEESISNLDQQDSLRHLSKHLVNDNIVISAAGSFDHDKLVNAIESNLKVAQGVKPEKKPASFLGSEVRMRDDTMPKAYISIAVHGEGLNSPDLYTAQVAAKIFGNFNIHSPKAHYKSSKLSSIVQEYNIVEKYEHFSKSLSDHGLWGFYAEIPDRFTIDDFVHFTLKQWNRLSISISEAEVARAKAQVKTHLLRGLTHTKRVATHNARDILAVGHQKSITEAFQKIDAITVADVKKWGQNKVWDRDIVISGTGLIEDLLDYNRNRNEMAMMRW
ncbi:Peptidase M16 inactive domain family protein [Candida parapsilosis]|uniref:Uncharacterized protein n=2 Tax=Candida parapsilosis TaxID=5480 RepID=G8B6M1_CANPC|nr:uncharacterized protein CPAR2_101410 [Candida parapsilosis]KAF6048081.1 Peptidase M16 inactive domain family protein [Candida parapsilosis]KAF6049952.1 Peptidase M16 inactive domain family protein [Candida parapsilosis]KAF6057815.1 Peptidase M16 inactive domain family protein [Candida parapsilosis]KAF6065478.1 Peptidase M16 inactive domain family protein [Candida parapsilosis]KAI5903381.1 Cytochrome b-c1 complex subunit 1 [Candida parapsilosis]